MNVLKAADMNYWVHHDEIPWKFGEAMRTQVTGPAQITPAAEENGTLQHESHEIEHTNGGPEEQIRFSRTRARSKTHHTVDERNKQQLLQLLSNPTKQVWLDMFNLEQVMHPPPRPILVKLADNYNMKAVFSDFIDYTQHDDTQYTCCTKAFDTQNFSASTRMTIMQLLTSATTPKTMDLRMELGLREEEVGSEVHSLSAISKWIKQCNLPYVEEIVKKVQNVVHTQFAQHKVSAAVFATAQSARTNVKSVHEWVPLHFDDGGAIVILLHGTKKWCFLPHNDVTWSNHPGKENEALDIMPWTPNDLWQEANMEAGDVLVMPSKEAHMVWTDSSTASLSLNIFIQSEGA